MRFADLVDCHSTDFTFNLNGVDIESTRYHEPDILDRMLEDERRDQEATDQTQNHEPIVTQVVEGETMDQTQDGGSPPLPIQQQQQAMHESSLVAEIQEGK